MEVIIESNIEVPKGSGRGNWKKENVKYPIDKLNVNDSFWVPKSKGASMRSTASRFKRHNSGWSYTVRSEKLDGDEGYRIWRTA
jgi:hypothetical protein